MCKLQQMDERDCQRVVDWNAGKDADFLCQWSGHRTYRFPLTVEQMTVRLGKTHSRLYKIMVAGEMAGTVELNEIDADKGSANVCRFLIREDCCSRGVGQKALRAVINMAFGELKLSRLELKVFTYNVRAIRCYQKAGFFVEQFTEHQDNPKWNVFRMALQKGVELNSDAN